MSRFFHPLALASRAPAALVAPVAEALDRARCDQVANFLADRQPQADALAAQLAEIAATAPQDAVAEALTDAVDAGAAAVLRQFRREALAGDGRKWLVAAAAADTVLRSERREILESAWLPEPVRRLEMRALDRVNRQFGSYAEWADRVALLVQGAANPHIVDVAAGSGGFLRWVAAHRRPLDWRMTATDYAAQFVAQGQALAAQAGLAVQFEQRDATRLGAFDPPAELVVCTQAAHHMPVGVLLRLLAAALRSARRGVLLIDVARGAGRMLAIGAGTASSLPFAPLMLDGMQSSRRAYAASELLLLARLAGARTATAQALGPVHVELRAVGSR